MASLLDLRQALLGRGRGGRERGRRTGGSGADAFGLEASRARVSSRDGGCRRYAVSCASDIAEGRRLRVIQRLLGKVGRRPLLVTGGSPSSARRAASSLASLAAASPLSSPCTCSSSSSEAA